MKRLFSVTLGILFTLSSARAVSFVPTYQLNNQIDTATEQLMDLVVQRGAAYGARMIQLLENFQQQFEQTANARNEYIADRLVAELKPFLTCVSNEGTWLLGVNECEHIDRLTCLQMNGVYDECASACRHDEESVVCTRQCVPVCEVPIDRQTTYAPDESEDTDDMIDDADLDYPDYDDVYFVDSTLRSCTNDKGYADRCYQIRSQDQASWELSHQGIIGLNWKKGFTYTVRANEVDGELSLIEILDKKVDLDICREYYDGCDICTVKNGVIQDCTDKNCSEELTGEPKCLQFVQ